MKPTGTRGRFFTVVIVPHSDGEVVSFRLPILVAQVACTLVAAFWVGLLVLVNAYLDALGTLDELVYLRATTREYHHRVEDLAHRAAAVERELAQLEQLDRQIRALLQQAPLLRPAAAPAAADATGGARPTAQAAARVPPPPAGGPEAADPLAELEQRLYQLAHEATQRGTSLDQLRDTLMAQQQAYDTTPTLWPVRGIITSPFGWRADPFVPWRRDFHPGLDIAAPYGTPVVAAASGVVVAAGWDGALGRVITIDHGAYVTRYGHNARVVVRPGQRVRKGQVIAYVGSTGRSTGPHVHYEVYLHGRALDPRHFLLER